MGTGRVARAPVLVTQVSFLPRMNQNPNKLAISPTETTIQIERAVGVFLPLPIDDLLSGPMI